LNKTVSFLLIDFFRNKTVTRMRAVMMFANFLIRKVHVEHG